MRVLKNVPLLRLIGKYKSVIWFLLIFGVVYLVLSLVYGFYLEHAGTGAFYPDYVTYQVAHQSQWLMAVMGYSVETVPHPDEASIKLMVNAYFLARVVEGCNGVSVIILFCAFVLAFFNGIVRTLVFLGIGMVSIYIVNVLRIGILAIAIYNLPEYSQVLHEVLFPLIIYGFVFLLWIYWIHLFKT